MTFSLNSKKPVGIIGAMEEEVAKLKEQMRDPEVTERAGMNFFKGELAGCGVVVVRSGVGKVSAALCTQILIDCFDAGAIINTGIAGSLDASIDIGDIVISTDAVQYDVHAEVWGYAPGQVPRLPSESYTADETLIAVAEKVCREQIPEIGCHRGRVLTGDSFLSDSETKRTITGIFGGSCVEMEGAAIAQAAQVNGVPWVVIRAISDKADDSATVDYQEFEEKAICHAVTLTQGILSYLSQEV